jgi:hypothetical protein
MATYTQEDFYDEKSMELVLHKNKFRGDTFDFSEAKWELSFRDAKFSNCTFIGGSFSFEGCVLEDCTFKKLPNGSLYGFEDTRCFDCDFYFGSYPVIYVYGNRVDLNQCRFHDFDAGGSHEVEVGEARSLAGSEGLPVEVTDPDGQRRERLPDSKLTVEELASKNSQAKTASAMLSELNSEIRALKRDFNK